mmetsp:Transcript_15052/g.17422  ORF Transcript_15052/g.17422 Transcript_15052/m.17422 type:complete len:217 (+) Transcript_15052:949-1599(+)
MLEKDPENRINMFNLMNHRWFELKDKELHTVHLKAELDKPIPHHDEVHHLNHDLDVTPIGFEVEMPKFSKPTPTPGKSFKKKNVIQILKRKMTIKPEYKSTKIKIVKESKSEAPEPAKIAFNSPISASIYKKKTPLVLDGKTDSKRKRNFKNKLKSSRRAILGKFNASQIASPIKYFETKFDEFCLYQFNQKQGLYTSGRKRDRSLDVTLGVPSNQ